MFETILIDFENKRKQLDEVYKIANEKNKIVIHGDGAYVLIDKKTANTITEIFNAYYDTIPIYEEELILKFLYNTQTRKIEYNQLG